MTARIPARPVVPGRHGSAVVRKPGRTWATAPPSFSSGEPEWPGFGGECDITCQPTRSSDLIIIS
jgi:hypothetical protein